ncbi:unnamed protein product, partial [Urochloa humidicola]
HFAAALPPNPTCRRRRSLRRRRGASAAVLSSNLSLPLSFHKPSAAHWGYVGGPDSWAARGAPTRWEPLAARVTGTWSSDVGEAPSSAWRPGLGDARATAMGAFRPRRRAGAGLVRAKAVNPLYPRDLGPLGVGVL